jgi:hypothetical protein
MQFPSKKTSTASGGKVTDSDAQSRVSEVVKSGSEESQHKKDIKSTLDKVFDHKPTSEPTSPLKVTPE